MASEEQKNVPDEDITSEAHSDGELFADEAQEGNLKSDPGSQESHFAPFDSAQDQQNGLHTEQRQDIASSKDEASQNGNPHKDNKVENQADAGQSDFGFSQELSEYELFAGDEDFYRLLEESSSQTTDEMDPVSAPPRVQINGKTVARQYIGQSRIVQQLKQYKYKRFSTLQKVLAVSIIIVVSMLLYVLFKSPSESVAGSDSMGTLPTDQSERPVRQTSVSSLSVTGSERLTQPQIQGQEPVLLPTQPLSLEVARNFYMQKDYGKAFAAYDELRRALPASEELLKDFLELKMALCAKQAADFEQASRLFTKVCQSRSPAVRIVANYHLCLLEIQRKRYLRARTRAYNTLALIKAVDFDDDWVLSFECDCSFLVAECLTRHIFMLGGTDTDLPADLWGKPTASSDPFSRLNEAELRRFLNSGAEHLGRGLLDPEIRKLEQQGGLPRWSVTSYGAPVEELLAKFAANANIDIHWAVEGTLKLVSAEESVRQRPVSLYLPAATCQQVVLTAAGCAGLLASAEGPPGKEKVTIYDPDEYSSLRQHISFLSRQAVSLWQKFVLTFYSDERLANAHFLMGLLHSESEMPIEAIAEYKLVANRFSQTSLAPFALLHSSKLKASLRDYPGAREDLKQLVEQYPDVEIYGQAYLRLADATKEAGLNDEAAKLYQRVYNFGLSAESKKASAIGAAECLYETKEYEETAKWLTRYIDLAGGDKNNSLYPAYFLLGKSSLALGKYQQACDAFKYALAEQSSREQYVEAITLLVKSHIKQGNFVEALDTLASVSSVALSQEQSVEMLLLKCRIFRMLGLLDTAIVFLRDRAEYVSEPQLNAKISYELALCRIAAGNLESARSGLSEILGTVEPGPLAQQIAMELVDVCLKLGRGSQAVSVCQQLLGTDVSGQEKQQILKMLAEAYNQQKDYEKATLALSGQWSETPVSQKEGETGTQKK
jgi:tetratricopeptide (TPR) repeat protein